MSKTLDDIERAVKERDESIDITWTNWEAGIPPELIKVTLEKDNRRAFLEFTREELEDIEYEHQIDQKINNAVAELSED